MFLDRPVQSAQHNCLIAAITPIDRLILTSPILKRIYAFGCWRLPPADICPW
jgi:hypothetical protein